MNFSEFVSENFTAENYDVQPFDAAELAWKACKEEVLKILRENRKYSYEFCMLKLDEDEIIEEIEKL